MRKYIIKFAWLPIIFSITIFPGCRSSFEKRVTKDIVGINEQLYDLEKEQIKTAQDVGKLKQREPVSMSTPTPTPEKVPLLEKKIKSKDKDEEDEIYKEGYKYYLEQNYTKAIERFSELTTQFDESTVTDNALYWQAESFYKLNQTDRALVFYQIIYRYFPFSNKADYSLFKIGTIYTERKDYNRALLAFTRLVEEYPASDLNKPATMKINEIKRDNKRRK
ncbi:MAG TPA: tetratricopeptide repeat protein [Candidatus Kapabacteria bacterium]|nr:tetratricopeptide repeat protein [Candidatus Kapabacteria bacterium]